MVAEASYRNQSKDCRFTHLLGAAEFTWLAMAIIVAKASFRHQGKDRRSISFLEAAEFRWLVLLQQ